MMRLVSQLLSGLRVAGSDVVVIDLQKILKENMSFGTVCRKGRISSQAGHFISYHIGT